MYVCCTTTWPNSRAYSNAKLKKSKWQMELLSLFLFQKWILEKNHIELKYWNGWSIISFHENLLKMMNQNVSIQKCIQFKISPSSRESITIQNVAWRLHYYSFYTEKRKKNGNKIFSFQSIIAIKLETVNIHDRNSFSVIKRVMSFSRMSYVTFDSMNFLLVAGFA